MLTKNQISKIKDECYYSTARSSGPGGQHVNKVETKVILRWSVTNSSHLSENQKTRLLDKLSSKLTLENEVVIGADAFRSQVRNKELAFKKLIITISGALKEPKKRKATKPSKAAINERLKKKKHHSDKKKSRQKPSQ